MKKILALAILGTLTLVSCKKDYSCTCTTTTTTPEFSFGGQIVQTASVTTASASTIINDKKDAAKTSCESGSVTSSVESQYAAAGAGATAIATVCSIAE